MEINPESEFVNTGSQINNAVQSQMFGKPCFKINGKAFACYFNKSMVFKLQNTTHEAALNLEGAKLFDPSNKNRPMKAWVEVPYTHQHLWLEFANHAATFVIESNK